MPEQPQKDMTSSFEQDAEVLKSRNRNSRIVVLLFVLTGLGFCGYYLYSSDQLYVPETIHWGYFCAGVGVAMLGHFADGASWRFTLRGIGQQVPFRVCATATAFAVLGKYIPGKIWMLAGRVIYLRRYTEVTLSQATSAVVFLQIVMLWVGLALGLAFSPFASMRQEMLWCSLAFLFAGGLVLAFWGTLKKLLSRRIAFFAKVPELGIPSLIAVSMCALLTWLLWSAGFVLSIRSVYGEVLPYATLGAFPLAAVLGILAIVLPGGIGVREGIIVGVFIGSGVSLEIATTLAIVSRLWFLSSELLFAALGFGLHLATERKLKHA